MPEFHQPVLTDELISLLDPKPGGVYLDATLGGAGHASQILERSGPGGILIGVDRDPEAIEFSRKRLEPFGERAVLVRGNFRDVRSILRAVGVERVDGAIADLGVSSHQLDSPRGFSFQRDEFLDMRMSALEEDTPTAAHIVNTYPEEQLANIIYRYGEERYSRRIARAIVERRREKPIQTTGELASIVAEAIPPSKRPRNIHPATRSFMAIRVCANRELEALEVGLPEIVDVLKQGARVCIVSFHSLEDRIVKNTFRRLSGRCECPPRMPECRCGAKRVLKVLTARPITPSAREIECNPRSRSSRLRCAERIAP